MNTVFVTHQDRDRDGRIETFCRESVFMSLEEGEMMCKEKVRCFTVFRKKDIGMPYISSSKKKEK